jgi:RNA polymerase sigma-54 factor
MAISLLKEFKQKQKISLTPQLKKSIDLLQLSRFELIQKIDQEVEINPFIEKEIAEDFEFDEHSSDQDFDFNFAATKNLRELLIDQINDLNLNDIEQEVACVIVECIDESGLLVDELIDIQSMISSYTSIEKIEEVLLNVIQNLQPTGIGYRDSNK